MSIRTTVAMEAPVLEKAKAMAAAVGGTVSEVVETAIVAQMNPEPDAAPFRLITVKGRSLRPGPDLDRINAILAAEDEAAALPSRS